MGQPVSSTSNPSNDEAAGSPTLTALHIERLDVGFSCEYCFRCREFSNEFPEQFRGHLSPEIWKQSVDEFNAVIRSSFLVSRPWLLYLNMPLGFIGIALILFSSDAQSGAASSMFLRYTGTFSVSKAHSGPFGTMLTWCHAGFSIFFITGIMSLLITFGWMISVNEVVTE